MKSVLQVCSLILLIACSHKPLKKPIHDVAELEDKISRQETKNMEDVKSDFSLILSAHPEIPLEIKNNVSQILDNFFVKHSELKIQESKIVNLKLQRAIVSDVQNHDDLKVALQKVYDAKAMNVFQLVREVKLAITPAHPSKSFYDEFRMFMKEVP